MAPDSYDTTRDYQTILRFQIEEGLKELERPAQGQFLSSLSCGLTLGIGVRIGIDPVWEHFPSLATW